MSRGAPFGAYLRIVSGRRVLELGEERLDSLSPEDVSGWEFKIVRSGTGRFANPETLAEVCREESLRGWELFERLDSRRLRFKRRIEYRRGDRFSGRDPYRDRIGLSHEEVFAVTAVCCVAGAIALSTILPLLSL